MFINKCDVVLWASSWFDVTVEPLNHLSFKYDDMLLRRCVMTALTPAVYEEREKGTQVY